MKIKHIISTLLVFIFCSSVVNAKQVEIATSTDSMPMLTKANGKYSGIHEDIYRMLCSELGLEYSITTVPRKRLEQFVKSGEMQIGSFLNKHWVKTDDFAWSKPIFLLNTVFLTRKDKRLKLNKIEDLEGLRVGCQLGYYYSPTTMEHFASGKIIRDNSNYLRQNLRRLDLGHIDTVLLTQIDAEFMLSHNLKYKDLFEIQPMIEGSSEINLMCSKKMTVPMEEINKAITKMHHDGSLKAVFAKYGINMDFTPIIN